MIEPEPLWLRRRRKRRKEGKEERKRNTVVVKEDIASKAKSNKELEK